MIPLLLVFIAIVTYNKVKEITHESRTVRYFVYIFFIVSLCSLLSIHSINDLESGSGGLIGDVTASMLVDNFNIIGSTIILITFLIIGITFWLKLSWVYIFEITGKYTIEIVSNIFSIMKKIPTTFLKDEDAKNLEKDIDFKRKLEKLNKVDDITIETEEKVRDLTDEIDKEKKITLFGNTRRTKNLR